VDTRHAANETNRPERTSGILLHPTSLPGRYGIGDLGREAHAFVAFLEASGQTVWQVLPLGPTGYGDSPYQCFSAFAGNPMLVSPELLARDGLVSVRDLDGAPEFPERCVDYGPVIEWKRALLARAFAAFRSSAPPALVSDFETFRSRNEDWLDDYALFRAIKDEFGGAAWNTWDAPLASRDPNALEAARRRLRDAVEQEELAQFLFFRQWSELRTACAERGIRIVGDVPIFVAYDSADVWANTELFKLDATGAPIVVAGVPPDYFSATGQLWGNPIYDWSAMRATGFSWWVERLRAGLRLVDVLRVDHFRGFAAAWEIPGDADTAVDGRWVEVPGRELFDAVQEGLGGLPIVAEDLGVITPDVELLRDHFGLPGMRVLQFAFADPDSVHLPHNYVKNSVAYTGTHDNDTAVGWLASRTGSAGRRERVFCQRYLATDGVEIHWDLIRAVFASVAETAIVPAQDLLGLGPEARMNTPGKASGNWTWRLPAGALATRLARRLRKMTTLYGRGARAS
jgi:4-alpha-glucanotransferase